MPKPRVLIDTNIILDYVLERQPFHAEAEGIILRLAKNESSDTFPASRRLTSITRAEN